MKPRFTGPYKVTKVINPKAYQLDLPATFRCHNVINISFLKRYHSKEISETTQTSTPTPTEDGEFEIEKILGHRRRYNRLEFLVSWKGAPSTENEWKAEKELVNAKDLLEEYKKKPCNLSWSLRGGECHVPFLEPINRICLLSLYLFCF